MIVKSTVLARLLCFSTLLSTVTAVDPVTPLTILRNGIDLSANDIWCDRTWSGFSFVSAEGYSVPSALITKSNYHRIGSDDGVDVPNERVCALIGQAIFDAQGAEYARSSVYSSEQTRCDVTADQNKRPNDVIVDGVMWLFTSHVEESTRTSGPVWAAKSLGGHPGWWTFIPNSQLSMPNPRCPDTTDSDLAMEPTPIITSSPTTIFDGQNFTFGKPQIKFTDNNGDFKILVNYTHVGHSVNFLNISLKDENCDNYVTDGVVTLNQNEFLNLPKDFQEPVVSVHTRKFSLSQHVIEKEKNGSIGVLKFCIRTEGFLGPSNGENIAVSFREDKVSLGYDLTKNGFEVLGNNIVADTIKTSENNITTSYNVTAFRCSKDDFNALIKPYNPLQQNEIIYICIKPDENENEVFISDFDMSFYQAEDNGSEVEKYKAVTNLDEINILSQVSEQGKTKKVASRVISEFFYGDARPLSVRGNAYLSFDSNRYLRSLQNSNGGGEGTFQMKVRLKKGTALNIKEEQSSNSVFVFSIIGGTLAFAIGFTLFKKLK